MVIKKVLFKNVLDSVRVDYLKNRELVVSGNLGVVKKKLSGKDILYLDNNLVKIQTYNSYKNFVRTLEEMVKGVIFGYYLELELEGLGYRFIILKGSILFRLGHSHYISIKMPKHLKVVGFRNKLIIFGLNLRLVSSFCGILKNLRKRDVYKGKGIEVAGKIKNIKVGKQR